MEINERELYNVVGNSDTSEGRGVSVDLGWFFNRMSARTFANGRGTMGSSATVKTETRKTVQIGPVTYLLGPVVFASVEDAEHRQKESVRTAALAKLTDAEKLALGLS